MKLTSQQIQELYRFTRQHFVEHYDVQMELVDHLANDIETIWIDESTLTFEKARDKSFKKFGVSGFMDVVDERTKVLGKKYWKLVWSIFKQFFRIPQVVTLLVIWASLFFAFEYFLDKWVFAIIGIGGLSVIVYRLIVLRRQRKKGFQKTQKKWLFEEHVLNIGNIGIFLNLFIQISFISSEMKLKAVILLVSFIFTAIIIFIYITTFHLSSKVEEILENQYPEYKLVTNS